MDHVYVFARSIDDYTSFINKRTGGGVPMYMEYPDKIRGIHYNPESMKLVFLRGFEDLSNLAEFASTIRSIGYTGTIPGERLEATPGYRFGDGTPSFVDIGSNAVTAANIVDNPYTTYTTPMLGTYHTSNHNIIFDESQNLDWTSFADTTAVSSVESEEMLDMRKQILELREQLAEITRNQEDSNVFSGEAGDHE